jgi:translation initiation factor IF-2
MTSLRLSATTLAALALSQFSSCAGPMPPERLKTYKLNLPRQLARGEALRARIAVGTLRRGDTIVVRTTDGEIVGSISPFGSTKQGQKVGIYTIPISPETVTGQTVTLTLEVVASAPDSTTRSPTEAEVEELSLEIIPSS